MLYNYFRASLRASEQSKNIHKVLKIKKQCGTQVCERGIIILVLDPPFVVLALSLDLAAVLMWLMEDIHVRLGLTSPWPTVLCGWAMALQGRGEVHPAERCMGGKTWPVGSCGCSSVF